LSLAFLFRRKVKACGNSCPVVLVLATIGGGGGVPRGTISKEKA